MHSALRAPLLSSLLMLCAAPALADDSRKPTNFRVGAGVFQADIGNAPSYLPNAEQQGFSLFAEFPQSNHTASRFILYRLNGEDDIQLQGGETQLMWGWGLAEPGLRIYSGPAWHYEKMLVQRAAGDHYRVFNGWGWQFGIGAQFDAITLDLAATMRDPKDYNSENLQAGASKGDVWTHNLLLSYRF